MLGVFIEVVIRFLLFWGDTGLFEIDVLERSKFMSELFSLPLLQVPSVSFLKLIVRASHQSLLFKACNCKNHTVKKC